MRDINDFSPKYIDETQYLLTLDSDTGSNSYECHFSFDVRSSRYVLYFPNPCQSFALFHYLLNSAVFTSCNYRHSRPVRIERLTNGDRFDIERACAEQPDDAR